MMSTLVAPTARRTPISRLRAVTPISMTFIITIPPMTTEIALTMMNTAKNAELMLRHKAMELSLVPMKKSFSMPAVRCRRARTISVA